MPRRFTLPTYRLHKQSGQPVVTLPDGFGHRRDYLLGPHGSPQSLDEYNRLIAEWRAGSGRLPPARGEDASATNRPALTVNELLIAYWKHAEEYYGWKGNEGTKANVRDAARVVKELYGHTSAASFGPLALKAVRKAMVERDWSRSYVNAQVRRVCRVWRWAAGEELVPASAYEALKAVEGLRRGKTEARETERVKPFAVEHIEATLPFLPPLIRVMVELQRLTGMRPGEVCRVRPIDLDMRNLSCWVFRPPTHKTGHLDRDRLVLIGPRAQDVLRPYLGTRLDAYCFCPRDAEEERRAAQRQARRSPLTPSQAGRKPKPHPKRAKRDHYYETSYRNAVYRACDRVFPPPEDLARRRGEPARAWQARLTPEQREGLRRWRREHRWHPNQLRHTRATELRPHGLDVTKTILGHAKVETTQIYAEKDLAAAMELVAKIG